MTTKEQQDAVPKQAVTPAPKKAPEPESKDSGMLGSLAAALKKTMPKPGEFGGQYVAPKMHSGGVVPRDGVYTLQKGEVVIPADHEAVLIQAVKHERSTEPKPDIEHGAPKPRDRKSESKVTEGTHVRSGGDPDDNRGKYIRSEYDRNTEKTASPSGRKPLKELAKKAKL